jgi:sugar O-acyltransferase (sialic acid O-acetyltransferase NeuD family)
VTSIVLFGVGSSLVVEYVETCNRLGYTVAAGVNNRQGGESFADASLVYDVGELPAAVVATPCICPQFMPHERISARDEAANLGFSFAPALIDPTAIVARSTTVGPGSFVNAGAILGAAGVLGEHVVVNRGAAIGHHVTIAPFASLGPRVVVAGYVTIGFGAMIGTGAVVLPKVTVGDHAVVGAGAVVVHDVPPRAVVFGNPARIVRTT